MKISELIEHLELLKGEFGDLPVRAMSWDLDDATDGPLRKEGVILSGLGVNGNGDYPHILIEGE